MPFYYGCLWNKRELLLVSLQSNYHVWLALQYFSSTLAAMIRKAKSEGTFQVGNVPGFGVANDNYRIECVYVCVCADACVVRCVLPVSAL